MTNPLPEDVEKLYSRVEKYLYSKTARDKYICDFNDVEEKINELLNKEKQPITQELKIQLINLVSQLKGKYSDMYEKIGKQRINNKCDFCINMFAKQETRFNITSRSWDEKGIAKNSAMFRICKECMNNFVEILTKK
jgi:hypothetical protein